MEGTVEDVSGSGIERCGGRGLREESIRSACVGKEREVWTSNVDERKTMGEMVNCGRETKWSERCHVEKKRRKREKELTGAEMRTVILEKNEMREVKKTKREGKKMVKLGNVKSIDSYFK